MLFENFNILTALFQSIITGYFTYFLIKSNDVLVLSNAKKEEKLAMVSFLSMINWAVYWLGQRLITIILPNLNFVILTSLSAILSLIIVVLLGFFVLPKLILRLYDQINSHRKKNRKLQFTNMAIRDSALDHDIDQYIYVFGFDGSYIASGYLNVYQYNTDEYNELLLFAPKEPEKRRTVEDVEELFWKNDMDILVDYEKRVKLYIVPMPEETPTVLVEGD